MDPFIHLKNSMKKTVFKDFSFSDERKNAVKEAISRKQSSAYLHSWKEETLIAVLETLQYEAKDGYEISTMLLQKHEFSFQNKEGQLYTLLHLLENREILTSNWIQEKKYYSLTVKGKRYLAAYKQGGCTQRYSLKALIEVASL